VKNEAPCRTSRWGLLFLPGQVFENRNILSHEAGVSVASTSRQKKKVTYPPAIFVFALFCASHSGSRPEPNENYIGFA
jgi:hypothetical protein